MRVAPHTAQASAAEEEIPCRTEHPILVSPYGRLSTPVLVQLALSPSVEASSLIAPLRPAGSPFRLDIPARAALSPPLQRSLRFLRHPLPPPPSPSLRLGYRRLVATGRVGLTLLSTVERRMGRLRPI